MNADHQLWYPETPDQAGAPMDQCTDLPPREIFQRDLTEKEKKPLEPPMNTDEHRLKTDKEKGSIKNTLLIFIISLPVCIGVHRWFKIIYFNLLNHDLSVDGFIGACDASVSS